MNIGDTVTDGTAKFKLKSLKQPGLIGEIKWYAGKSTPVGYLVCDGSAVSRTNYAELYSAIGTTYGTGDGSTTFNLPCLTDGRFVEGNTTPGTKRNAGLPNITGMLGDSCGDSGIFWGLNGCFYGNQHSTNRWLPTTCTNAYVGGETYFSAAKSNSIYGGSSTVQPKSITLKPIIKYI